MIARNGLMALILLFLLSAPSFGQDWARKMFDHTTHDFGVVPRSGPIKHFFELENVYKEDIHIAAVRSSCGCSTPKITKSTLKTYEKGSIVVLFNTERFSGQKNATITVTIDRPYYAEVQLNVSGFIRTDLIVEPGAVDFGSIDQGTEPTQKVHIRHYGSSSWQITGIETTSAYVKAEALETFRSGGQVEYDMMIRMLASAPEGYIQESFTVLTSEGSSSSFPVEVSARVISELTVNPSPLFLGIVQSDQATSKSLIVKGKRPFLVTKVECSDPRFTCKALPKEPKNVHVLPIEFTATGEPGKITQPITIHTNIGSGVSVVVETHVQVTVPEITSETTAAEPMEETPVSPEVSEPAESTEVPGEATTMATE
ncbi:Secreted protein containing DUF1573 [Planctomycetales bacterium 10988]|nr:Secreted protein containing DUF1573 [Planctomycetales bacterium 10988]